MEISTARLLLALRQRELTPARELREALGVSPPTLMRLVRAAGAEVLSIGQARRRAYAARRPLRGSLAPLPVYEVDPNGTAREVALLHLGHRSGTWFEVQASAGSFVWPLNAADSRMHEGWFEGIPYFLQDLRPQGFLGRQFAQQHAAVLQVSPDPRDWSDDDALQALSLLGADHSGNFIIGQTALQAWQRQAAQLESQPITDDAVESAYTALAQRAMTGGPAGSSAGGEFPKFCALRKAAAPGAEPQHVLVKFSGMDRSAGTQRWSDLLVCEHLAVQQVAAMQGLLACTTRVLQAGGRTFLEVDRFDRHGERGRSGLCSWAAINADWYGLAGRPWSEGARRLRDSGLIDDQTQHAITRLMHFGRLIANTDMHDGNLSFQPQPGSGQRQAGLQLAPVYDMLSMAYRPQIGVELATVAFTPQPPVPAEREDWLAAVGAAQALWQTAAADARISSSFRRICARNARLVREAVGRM